MSKPRKTPVPLPGSKTKTPIPAPSSKKTPIPPPGSSSKSQKKVATAQLSQEFVDDSGDSSDEAAAKGGAQQQKAPVSIAVHRPKSNGVAAKAKPDAKKKPKDASKPATKGAVTSKKPAPKQVVQEEDGASTSSSDSSEDEGTDIKQAQQREAAKKATEHTDSSSEVSSDSSDESEEESAPAVQQTNTRPTQNQTQTVTFQQARPYVPPEDFNAVSTDRAASSASTNVFKNLNGKQIWHITAPESVSLKQLTRLAMEKAQNGEAILEHKGTGYGFAPSEDVKGREVLIPVANGYKAGKQRIGTSASRPRLTYPQCLRGYRKHLTSSK